MAKVGRFMIALALFAALGLAACDSNSSPTPTSGPTNSDAELVKQAGVNMKALKSYHVEVVGSMANGSMKISGDIDAGSGNSRLDMNVAGQDLQTIWLGNDHYASTDGGKTFYKPSGIGPQTDYLVRIWDSFNPASIDKNASNFKDGVPSHETVAGVDTKHITAASSDLSLGSATSANSTIDLWITTNDIPYVLQLRVAGQSGSQGVNLTFNWSHLNENLDIKAPSILPLKATLTLALSLLLGCIMDIPLYNFDEP